jgi:hypothetical protein
MREFDSIRSRSANIVIRTFTNNYLVLVVAGYASVFFSLQSYMYVFLGSAWL